MAPLIAPQLTLEIRPIDAMWFLLLQLLSLAHWVSRAIYAVGLTYALTVRFPEPPGGLTAVYEEDGMIVWAGFPGALAVVLYPCPVQGGGGSRANEERSALNVSLLLRHYCMTSGKEGAHASLCTVPCPPSRCPTPGSSLSHCPCLWHSIRCTTCVIACLALFQE